MPCRCQDGPVSDEIEQLARMRREYTAGGLGEDDLAADWITQFERWFAEYAAVLRRDAAHIAEPNAMIVATASAGGVPSARTVLLKGFDREGFTFYTNYESRKGRELTENPQASLVFPWYALQRQVVVCGDVERVPRAETERYFAVRP